MKEKKIRKLGKCKFWSAVKSYVKGGGEYGNWCGKGEPKNCKDKTDNQSANKYLYGKIMKNGEEKNYYTISGKITKDDVKFDDDVSVCNDGGLDAACSLHDSGSYNQDYWYVMTLNWCVVDKDFKTNRDAWYAKHKDDFGKETGAKRFKDGKGNSAWEGWNGANCLFNRIGCLRYTQHKHWYHGWWSNGHKGITTVSPKGNYGNKNPIKGTHAYAKRPT